MTESQEPRVLISAAGASRVAIMSLLAERGFPVNGIDRGVGPLNLAALCGQKRP
jgi:hypothetical protein